MKAILDEETCIGCGVCCKLCPEVFELAGDKAQVKGTIVPPKATESCNDAVDQCPVTAISIQD